MAICGIVVVACSGWGPFSLLPEARRVLFLGHDTLMAQLKEEIYSLEG